MNRPKVSVVIPAYNEEKFIKRALESLKSQDLTEPFEVIVVDNASLDKTAEISKNLGAKVVTEPQKGVQFARQTGFKNANGNLIASTDADTILPSDWLSKMQKRLAQDQSIVAVGGWFHHESGSSINKVLINHLSRFFVSAYKKLARKKVLSGANFMVRKSTFLKTGGFENKTSLNEDLLLAQKLAKLGTVEIHFEKSWSVATSHRKWTKGFMRASLPYVINGFIYAFLETIVIKNLADIRTEKVEGGVRPKIVLALVALLFFVFLYVVPVSQVDAKIDPIAKKAQEKIESLQNFGNEHFVH